MPSECRRSGQDPDVEAHGRGRIGPMKEVRISILPSPIIARPADRRGGGHDSSRVTGRSGQLFATPPVVPVAQNPSVGSASRSCMSQARSSFSFLPWAVGAVWLVSDIIVDHAPFFPQGINAPAA